MTSIVIAAHDEGAVIGRCLDAFLESAAPGEFDVTVVANGCTDATAQIAAKRDGVRVLELATAGKAMALNAGDAQAVGFPRIYLDADIVLPADKIRELCHALVDREVNADTKVLAVSARRVIDVSRSPLPVRGYFAINSRLPAFRDSLFGRGVMALSAEGRNRFGQFPDIVADDLFVDSLFSSSEKGEVPTVSVSVRAPRTTRALVRRLVRVRRGNTGLRAASLAKEELVAVRPRDSLAWLRDVVGHDPTLIPAATCYAVLTVLAILLARRPERGAAWGKDESSRDVTDLGNRPYQAKRHIYARQVSRRS